MAGTAAEVDLLPGEGAAATGLWHPVGAAEAVERVRVEPDLRERLLAHVVERETGDRRRRLARKHLAGGRDHHRFASPTAHARLRIVLVVVPPDPEALHRGARALACTAHRRLRRFERGSGPHGR